MAVLNQEILEQLEKEQELTRLLALVKNVAIIEYDGTNTQVSAVFHELLTKNSIDTSIVKHIILFGLKANDLSVTSTLKSLFPSATIEYFTEEWQNIAPSLIEVRETMAIHACISENLNFNHLNPTIEDFNEQKLLEKRKNYEKTLTRLGLRNIISSDDENDNSPIKRHSTIQPLINMWKATRQAYQVCVLYDNSNFNTNPITIKCELKLQEFFTHIEVDKPRPTQYCLDKQNYIKIYGEKLSEQNIFFQCFEEAQQGCDLCNQCDNYGQSKKCPFAQRTIARFFREGFFVPQNNEIAHQWEVMAARQLYKPALVQVADDLATGTGCEANILKAVNIYDEFARQNDDHCLRMIVEAIDRSDDISQSRALPYIAMLAQNGDDDMTLRLAEAFQNGDLGLPKDMIQQESLIRQGALDGKPRFIKAMAQMFEANEKWNDAYQWYKELEEAAPELLPEGKLEEIEIKLMTEGASDKKIAQIGIDYLYGYNGVSRNTHFAYRCFVMANRSGVILAKGMLGQMYYYGIEVDTDIDKGLDMLSSAASEGDLLSIEKLIEIKEDNSNDYSIKDTWSDKIVGLLEDGISNNDPIAHFLKGKYTLEGKFFKQNDQQAFEAIAVAARLHYPRAMFMLAMMHKDGTGTKASQPMYEQWIKNAAHAGHYKAMGMYGPILFNNNEQGHAFKMISSAFEQGFYSTDAIYCLAQCYTYGYGTKSNKPKAYELYQQAAQDGNAKAQVKLCEDYFRGNEYLEKNYEQCRRWGEEAIKQGEKSIRFETAFSSMRCGHSKRGKELYLELANENDSAAMNNYACYLDDPKEKFYWFEKAANRGDCFGMWNLGNAYINGNGVDKDIEHGLSLIVRGANNGCPGAAEQLARMYETGDNVEIDGQQAINWLEKAISLGSEDSLFNLANLYYNGEIVAEDFKKALHYYKLASEKNNVQAFVMQGVLYLNGWGAEKDLNKAIFWYRKAAVAGNSFAKKELKKLNINWENYDAAITDDAPEQ